MKSRTPPRRSFLRNTTFPRHLRREARKRGLARSIALVVMVIAKGLYRVLVSNSSSMIAMPQVGAASPSVSRAKPLALEPSTHKGTVRQVNPEDEENDGCRPPGALPR